MAEKGDGRGGADGAGVFARFEERGEFGQDGVLVGNLVDPARDPVLAVSSVDGLRVDVSGD